MSIVFMVATVLLVLCPHKLWPALGGALAATSGFAECWWFAALFALIALDPWVSGVRVTSLKRRNVKRHAERLARNFHARPAFEPFCAVAEAARRSATSGLTGWPTGWTRCWGEAGQAHFGKARGMGGVNSEPADDPDEPVTVYLCRAHHREQEGRTEDFEAKYDINLKEAARAQHRGLGDMLI